MMRNDSRRFQSSARARGVTLIELMVSVAVLAVLVAIAVPTFVDFRERSVVRGGAEQFAAVIAEARFQAVKRDTTVTVNVRRGSADTAACIGAVTGTAACDCFERSTADADFCTVTRYPELDGGSSVSGEEQATALLKGIHLNTDPSTAFGGNSAFSIDPKLGTLLDLADGGSITFYSPSTAMNYRMQLTVNALGRTTLCVASGSRAVTGYSSC